MRIPAKIKKIKQLFSSNAIKLTRVLPIIRIRLMLLVGVEVVEVEAEVDADADEPQAENHQGDDLEYFIL